MREDTKVSNYCKFDSQLLTTFTSSLYIAGLIASLFASSVTRAFGRKASILVGGTAFLAGSALGGAAFNIYMLIFGRVLLGVGIGFANQSVPLYLSEMAPPKHRGAFNIGFQVCIAIGVLSANLLNYGTQKIKGDWGWRISLAMAAAPASILTLGALFMPETPNSIIQRSNDHQEAKRMLQRVRGTADVEAELNDLIRASSISKTINHPFNKIIQRKYRPQLVMAILIPFFQQVTGINIIGLYAPVLLRTLKLGESTSLLLSAVVTGGIGTVLTITSMILVDKLGRKILFLVGGIQILVSQVIIGSIMAAELGDHGGLSQSYAYLILVLVCVYSAGFSYSWGPLACFEDKAAANMAAGLAITSEGGRYYNGKMTVFVVLSCIVAATGGLIFGFDIGISGGVTSMEPFLKKFFPEVYRKMKEDTKISNYCKFDSQLLAAFTSSLYISGLIASLFASTVTRAFGRKASILVGGTAFLAGSAIGGAALNIYMLIFGRVLLGVGIGFTNQSVPLYLSEMAPPKHRGAFTIGFQVCVAIGVLSANLLNYGTQKIKGGWGWRISLAMAAAPASILTIGGLFLPETPNSIIQRTNDYQKAEKMLQRVRGTADVQAELDDLIRAGSVSKNINHPFKKIIQRKYRPQLVMAILIPFFQQVTGVNIISFYAPVLFRTIKLSENTSLLMSALVTGGIGTVSAILPMILADKLGRKVLFLLGGIQMLLSQVMIGSIMAAQLGDHGGFSIGYAYLILVLICVYKAGFGFSWGPLGWLVPSEIFPLEIRSAGQSITVAVGLLFTSLVAQTFLAMLCHFKAGVFFFFGGWLTVMTTFAHFFLPETKNVPIELMDKVWREHWFWRKFFDDVGEESKIQGAIHLKYFQRKSEAPVTPTANLEIFHNSVVLKLLWYYWYYLGMLPYKLRVSSTALLEAVICQFQPALPQTSHCLAMSLLPLRYFDY
ncbi:hypothetical protein WN944_024664 [Citrus x changshan-huyou]|uniref:Major facilitator superfamily (MFS) profile domain-containing protein n=1 Tax=Citrus x changshan-huyou TaxID=2935761 RepID=A0AAP0LNZ6_9ROSI